MNTKTIIALFAVMLLAANVFAGGKSLDANSVEQKTLTGTEEFVRPIIPGTMTISDGNYHMRNQVDLYLWITSDPRVSGYLIVVTNTRRS